MIGVFIADNVGNYNIIIRALVKRYFSNESKGARRGRCLGYIINLAAQAFIYSKKNKAFVNKVKYV